MNKVKLFTLLIFFISLFGMVSCNNDDPVDKYMPPTPDEVKAAFERVKGNYTGKLVYEKENFTRKSSQNDTVDINCQITNDSTFIIKSFPSKLLALNVKDKALKEAISKAAPQDITCRIGFYKINPIVMIVNPLTPSFDLTYKNAKHRVMTPFYINNAYSFARQGEKEQFLVQIVEAVIFVDGKQAEELPKGNMFKFLLKRS